jgi:hypothetical protein
LAKHRPNVNQHACDIGQRPQHIGVIALGLMRGERMRAKAAPAKPQRIAEPA